MEDRTLLIIDVLPLGEVGQRQGILRRRYRDSTRLQLEGRVPIQFISHHGATLRSVTSSSSCQIPVLQTSRTDMIQIKNSCRFLNYEKYYLGDWTQRVQKQRHYLQPRASILRSKASIAPRVFSLSTIRGMLPCTRRLLRYFLCVPSGSSGRHSVWKFCLLKLVR